MTWEERRLVKQATQFAVLAVSGLALGYSPNRIEWDLRKSNPGWDPQLIKLTTRIAVQEFDTWYEFPPLPNRK